MKTLFRFCLGLLLLMLAGCANVHYAPGSAKLGERSVVFGKMLLVRDGEPSVINTFGTAVRIGRTDSIKEPGMITESFGQDGSFYWALTPGHYYITIALNLPSDDIVSFAFDVPKAKSAYYFGDLMLVGKKHFNTISGANIKDVSARFEDHFDADRAALLQRNPGLPEAAIGRLAVADISRDAGRYAAFRKLLDEAPLCCKSMAEFHFEKLAKESSETFDIGPQGGTFPFPGGRSYFRAFELPAYTAPYVISLRSLVMPTGMAGKFRIFAPAAMLLDAHYNVIGTVEQNLFHPVAASILPPRSASLEGDIAITADKARARYLVVYTTDALLGRTRGTSIPGVLPIPGGALPTGISRPAWMEPWVVGRIKVTLSAHEGSGRRD